MSGSATRCPSHLRGGRLRALVLVLAVALALVLAARPASAQQPGKAEDESAQFVAEARAAVREGRTTDAARSLDQAIQLNPRRIEAYVLRGAVYQAQGKLAEGIALMQRARGLAPGNTEVLAGLGALLVAAGKRDEGVPLLEEAVRRDGRRYEAYLALGQAWRRDGQHRRAVVALRTYFQVRPSELVVRDPEYLIDLADSYLRARLPRAAEAVLDQRLTAAIKAEQAQRRTGQKAEARPARVARIELLRAMVAVALDCRRAEPLLRALTGSAAADVPLLLARCALGRGQMVEALGHARRYVPAPERRADQLGLLADIYVELGNVAQAEDQLAAALQLEPGRRAWLVRRASLWRRAADPGKSVRALDALGPPASADSDLLWWREKGLALLAMERSAAQLEALRQFHDALAAVLAPEVTEPADDELFAPPAERPAPAVRVADARLWTLLAELELVLGESQAAVVSAGTALALQKSRAAGELLERAVMQRTVELAAEELAGGDARAAVARMASISQRHRAAPRGPLVSTMWRNLGVAHLMLGNLRGAIEALELSGEAMPTAIGAMLLGRALASNKEVARARAAYQQATALAAGEERLEVAIDRASFELSANEPNAAVAVLQAASDALSSQAPAFAGGSVASLGARFRSAQATAHHAAGRRALREGQGAAAVKQLEEAMRFFDEVPVALRCDHALAKMSTPGGNATRILQELGKTECSFAAGEGLALKLLGAVSESETPSRAGAALASVLRQPPRSAVARPVWLAALRVVAINAAAEAYRQGNVGAAREHLRRARTTRLAFGEEELALGEKILELHPLFAASINESGRARMRAAVPVLERLTQRVPEADVALGLAYDYLRDPAALAAWRRARRNGVRLPQLSGWIEAKERIEAPPVGAAPGGEP